MGEPLPFLILVSHDLTSVLLITETTEEQLTTKLNYTNKTQLHKQNSITQTKLNYTNKTQLHKQNSITQTKLTYTNKTQLHKQNSITHLEEKLQFWRTEPESLCDAWISLEERSGGNAPRHELDWDHCTATRNDLLLTLLTNEMRFNT